MVTNAKQLKALYANKAFRDYMLPEYTLDVAIRTESGTAELTFKTLDKKTMFEIAIGVNGKVYEWHVHQYGGQINGQPFYNIVKSSTK